MKVFTITILNRIEKPESEIIDFLKQYALAEDYSIEESMGILKSYIFRKKTLNLNGTIINRISSLPYYIVNYDSHSKKIYLSLCYNAITILSFSFALFLIIIILYSCIKNQEYYRLTIPVFLLAVMVNSIIFRLRPFLEFRKIITLW